jgi:hypothetical protein
MEGRLLSPVALNTSGLRVSPKETEMVLCGTMFM